MNGADQLLEWFESGELERPGSMPTTVELMAAIAGICGVPEFAGDRPAGLLDAIGTPNHLVFALIDGLGIVLLDHLRDTDFLRRQLVRPLHAVFPSTTASALTSVATGVYATEHAIPGWWTRVPAANRTATVLPYLDRFSGESLLDCGVDPDTLFRAPPLLSRFRRDVMTFTPQRYAGSVFTAYSSAGTPVVGYHTLDGAIDDIIERIDQSGRPTYTYLYFDQVDAQSHQRGPESPVVGDVVRSVNKALGRLASATRGRARLVVSADHGHISVEPAQRHLLAASDPLMETLRDPPAGEPRIPMFRIVPGRDASFRERFAARLGHHFALLSIAEVDELRLFGPDSLSPEARLRIGDFIGVARGHDVITYRGPGRSPPPMRGYHAGLTAAEMRIPLIVA